MSVFSLSSTNGQNLTNFFICIYNDKIKVGTSTCHFWQVCNSYGLRVMSEFLIDNLDNKWSNSTIYLCVLILTCTRSMLELIIYNACFFCNLSAES